jgi:hypothetical protein
VPTVRGGPERAVALAETWCRALLDGARPGDVAAIRRALFPNGAPDPTSSWWRTPLGTVLGPP